MAASILFCFGEILSLHNVILHLNVFHGDILFAFAFDNGKVLVSIWDMKNCKDLA